MIKQLLYGCAVISILFVCTCLGVLFYVSEQPWVDFSVLEHYNPGKPSILLDDEGNEWGRFQLEKREVIKLKDMPAHVINAFLAAEDWKYFTHAGLSVKGIVRSLLTNIARFKKAQGASTITQQLVRLLYFETEKSFTRKIKEQILALVIERQFTKEQILETYLNHIYLGSGIYGVEAATQRFWGKQIKDISLDEAAILASIVRCPQHYCPLYSPEHALKRRNLILSNMYKLKFITKKEYEDARQKPVITVTRDKQCCAPHLKETIRLMLEDLVGKHKLYTGGLRIQTTLNRQMQDAAAKSFNAHLTKLRKKFSPTLEGALLSIEGSTGQIKALIGGSDFQTSQFNRALKARRQLGSTFKPLIYAHALSQGRRFTDCEIDEPIMITLPTSTWTPRNSSHTFDGLMSLAHALSTSNNSVAIKTFLASGPEGIVSLAQACGLQASEPYPSLALGCLDGTLSEAVAMINIFAQQGTYYEPHMVLWVKDEWGTKLWKANPMEKAVIAPRITAQVAKVLMIKIDQARNRNPKTWFSCEAFGKTGTTNDARTCWFTGATPRYTTGIYLGYDNNRLLGDVFSSQIAFPLWKEFNNQIKNDIQSFTFDPSLKELMIHPTTGLPTTQDDPKAISVFVQE